MGNTALTTQLRLTFCNVDGHYNKNNYQKNKKFGQFPSQIFSMNCLQGFCIHFVRPRLSRQSRLRDSFRSRRNSLQRLHHRLRPLRAGQHGVDGHVRRKSSRFDRSSHLLLPHFSCRSGKIILRQNNFSLTLWFFK